jgi:hypothetical protein
MFVVRLKVRLSNFFLRQLTFSAYLLFPMMIPCNASETLLAIFADVYFSSNFKKGWLIFNNNTLK